MKSEWIALYIVMTGAALIVGALLGFGAGHQMAVDACTAPATVLSKG